MPPYPLARTWTPKEKHSRSAEDRIGTTLEAVAFGSWHFQIGNHLRCKACKAESVPYPPALEEALALDVVKGDLFAPGKALHPVSAPRKSLDCKEKLRRV
jgi:hypothetical protein